MAKDVPNILKHSKLRRQRQGPTNWKMSFASLAALQRGELGFRCLEHPDHHRIIITNAMMSIYPFHHHPMFQVISSHLLIRIISCKYHQSCVHQHHDQNQYDPLPSSSYIVNIIFSPKGGARCCPSPQVRPLQHLPPSKLTSLLKIISFLEALLPINMDLS